MVGVNKYRGVEEATVGRFEVDQEAEVRQITRLNKLEIGSGDPILPWGSAGSPDPAKQKRKFRSR